MQKCAVCKLDKEQNFILSLHIIQTVIDSEQIEEMNEFSEPEDLMEGIHVAVEEGEAYEHVLPHLTVENGHVHQEHVRQWYVA